MARKWSKADESNGDVAVMDAEPIGDVESEPAVDAVEAVPAEPGLSLEDRIRGLEITLRDITLRQSEIEESAREVDRLMGVADRKKYDAKIAKERWEGAVEHHMELCRSWQASKEVASRPIIAACESKAAGAEAPGSEAWREVPIEALDLPSGILEKLGEAGFKTLGDMANWSRENSGFNNIPGVGPAKRDQIEDAFVAYWAANPPDAAKAVGEPEAEEDGGDTAA